MKLSNNDIHMLAFCLIAISPALIMIALFIGQLYRNKKDHRCHDGRTQE